MITQSNTSSRKRKQLIQLPKDSTDIIENINSATITDQPLNISTENLMQNSDSDRSTMVLENKAAAAAGDNKTNLSQEEQIDYGLYSRQIYALGKDVMINMAKTNVLVSGMDGLGVEIAKNLILGGFKCVDIHDTIDTSLFDLSTQYYLNENEDIGKNRAICCYKSLTKLNSYVNVGYYTEPLTESFFKQYSIVVIVNGPLALIEQCSQWARTHAVKLIVSNTRGLIGQIFCDLGEQFVSNDPTGEELPLLLTSHVTNDGYVTMLDRKRHGLVDGDYVSFSTATLALSGETCATQKVGSSSSRMSPPFKVEIVGPDSFHIVDAIPDGMELVAGNCIKVAMPTKFNFLPFKEACIRPEFVVSNFAKCELYPLLHLSMLALLTYQQKYQSFPAPHNREDAMKFIDTVKQLNESGSVGKVDHLDEELLVLIAMQSLAQVTPVHGIIGGITAQEVIKASSYKYTPINQWFYYDALELINNDHWKQTDPSKFNIVDGQLNLSKGKNTSGSGSSRSLGQIALFGLDFQTKLEQSSVFIVGAGAIGCELLKNLALMGVSCGEATSSSNHQPTIYVTDMDIIERSNLSRQFLFRNSDIGQMKSVTAANAVLNINPHMNIKSFQLRVGMETESVFNSTFYRNINCILNALDNVDSRRYMDEQSICHGVSMIDGGTLGTCGNVQVVIPHITESYSSSNDPEETSIPVCTLKHFPYLIEHAIQWARDQFEGLFKNPPDNSLSFLSDNNFFESTFNPNSFDYSEAVKSVYSTLIDQRPICYDDCVRLARNLFDELFFNSIKQLLFTLPADHIGVFGQPFWIPPKRCPVPLVFDLLDENHFNFIVSTANLFSHMYHIELEKDKDLVCQLIKNYTPPEFIIDRSAVIYENEEQEEEHLKSANTTENEKELIDNYLHQLKSKKFKPDSFSLRSIDFEKDDDTNFHMQFIHSCSNLRANNYTIENADYHKTKQIAGKIIPAIATTTAVVAGLECIELYKVLAKFDNIEKFQNSFLNLAYTMVAGTEPCAPKFTESNKGKFTFWDVVTVEETNPDGTLMTLSNLISHIKGFYNLGNVCMLNHGKRLLYADFVSNVNDRLKMLMRDIVFGHEPLKPRLLKEFILLECLVEDLEGNDCDIPLIKFIFSH